MSGFLLYYKRDRINQARKKCCAPFSLSSADKDGAKVEDANGEFSHEMQIKASGNEYTVDNSNWVSLILFKKKFKNCPEVWQFVYFVPCPLDFIQTGLCNLETFLFDVHPNFKENTDILL